MFYVPLECDASQRNVCDSNWRNVVCVYDCVYDRSTLFKRPVFVCFFVLLNVQLNTSVELLERTTSQ